MSHRVLIAEDDARNRKLFRCVLERADIEVCEAVNGEEVVAMAQEAPPDLIILDIRMPVMDGLTAMGLLKEDPRTRDVPVVAVTASVMPEEQALFEQAGFDRVLRKPISVHSFLSDLLQLLNSGSVNS